MLQQVGQQLQERFPKPHKDQQDTVDHDVTRSLQPKMAIELNKHLANAVEMGGHPVDVADHYQCDQQQ